MVKQEPEAVTEFTKHDKDAPSDVKSRLRNWFSRRIEHQGGLEISGLESPAANGYSALTYVMTLKYGQSAHRASSKYVVRQDAANHVRLLKTDFVPPIQVQQALGEVQRLRVPRVLWIEADRSVLGSPFCVMEYVDGLIPSDDPPYTAAGWVLEATAEQRQQMARSAAQFLQRLHAVDWRELGLDFLRKSTVPGQMEIEAGLDEYSELLSDACEGVMSEIGKRTKEWLLRNMPSSERLGVVWGDARLGNMIFADFELAAAIDWEMVSLGDPTRDVAYFSYLNRFHSHGLGMSRLPGLPIGEAAVGLYEDSGEMRVRDFAFYEVFAGYSSLAIFTRHLQILEQQNKEAGNLTREHNPPAKILNQLMNGN